MISRRKRERRDGIGNEERRSEETATAKMAAQSLNCVSLEKERERDTGEEGDVRENGETCTAKMRHGEIKEMTVR